MGWTDAAGLAGVLMMVAAYGAVTAGWLDPRRWLALGANFIGSSLVLLSLAHNFNLSAVVMETVWALVALAGMARLVAAHLRGR
jgi:hypothetical protein